MASESTTTTAAVSTDLRDGWRLFMGLGVIIAVLGIVALLTPFVTGLVLSIGLGLVLVVGGFGHVATAFAVRGWAGSLWQIILAIVYLVAGVALVLNPLLGLATLTVLLVAYLLFSGLVEIAIGLRMRGGPEWGWMVASGVFSLLVAVLLWIGLPSTARWAVGLLVGVSLLSTGVSMILVANAGRTASKTAEEVSEETTTGT